MTRHRTRLRTRLRSREEIGYKAMATVESVGGVGREARRPGNMPLNTGYYQYGFRCSEVDSTVYLQSEGPEFMI